LRPARGGGRSAGDGAARARLAAARGGRGIPSAPMAERTTPPPDARERLRALPSVDRLATAVARAELAERRAGLLAGDPAGDATDSDLVAGARERLRPSLRRELNAADVVA